MTNTANISFLDLGLANAAYADELKAAACRVIDSGRYVGGAEVEALESDLRALTGAPFAVGVSNGLDALRLIMRAYVEMGVMKPGDEVIVPANTYIATFLAIDDAGLVPVPVEPDPATFNLDTRRLSVALTPRTRAVLPVHLYGRICWDGRLAEFVRQNGLKVIEDAAQSIGARSTAPGPHGSCCAAALGDAGALSFYPTKNIGALGDAGAVVTHDEQLAAAVRALANYGADRRYHNIYRGFNCRLDPIQAAMLRVKLAHIDSENEGRRRRAALYDGLLDGAAGVVRPAMPADAAGHVWHQYVVRIPGGRRDAVQGMLREQGIMTDIHYAVPPHLQPCYEGRWSSADLPLTARLAGEVLSLPVGTGTTDDEVARVARALADVASRGG